jgi:hypothetical protein
VGLLFSAVTGSLANAECNYSEKARNKIVRPVLEKFVGENEARYYVNTSPVVKRDGSQLLVLIYRRQPFKISAMSDGTVLNYGQIEIYFDTCKLRAWVPIGAIL